MKKTDRIIKLDEKLLEKFNNKMIVIRGGSVAIYIPTNPISECGVNKNCVGCKPPTH